MKYIIIISKFLRNFFTDKQSSSVIVIIYDKLIFVDSMKKADDPQRMEFF